MTEKEYRTHPALSRSEMFGILESPEKFKFQKEQEEISTPALVIGQAFHKLVLQPESFDDEFAMLPKIDRRLKGNKIIIDSFLESNQGKTIITEDQMSLISEMASSVRGFLDRNSHIAKLFDGEKEKEFFWTDAETGEECKCRTDIVTSIGDLNVIVDLKTTGEADAVSFQRSAIKYGYDFQAAWYSDGVSAVTGKNYCFVFFVIEKAPPYAINVFVADDDFVKRGRMLCRKALKTYHECKESGNWYGYLGENSEMNTLSLPAWLAKEIE